jgi:hypothetical protein
MMAIRELLYSQVPRMEIHHNLCMVCGGDIEKPQGQSVGRGKGTPVVERQFVVSTRSNRQDRVSGPRIGWSG